MPKQHKVALRHGSRSFSAWSSHPQAQLGMPGAYNRVIFLLHGFPDNNDTYNEIAPLLQKHFGSGLLTLAPLLRGYEPSSLGPDNEYAIYEVASDVAQWIENANPSNALPVHLVGHDWGAVVAFKTSSKYPQLVTSVVTMAIPYLTNLRLYHLLWHCPKQIYCSSYMLSMQTSWLYGRKFGDFKTARYLEDLWSYWSPGWDYSSHIGSVKKTLSQPGVLDGATAYYRNVVPWKNLKEMRWPVDFENVPTLILGGEQDGCMLSAVYDLESRMLAACPRVRVQLVSDVGHFMHREHPERLAGLICDWFDKYPGVPR